MAHPTVYICTGSSCREERKAFDKLLGALAGRARVQRVKCQKICDGPVAGLEVNGTLEWFELLSTAKRRAALLKLIRTGVMPRRIKKRRVKKRSGKLRT